MEDANVVRVELDMLFHTDVWESMMRYLYIVCLACCFILSSASPAVLSMWFSQPTSCVRIVPHNIAGHIVKYKRAVPPRERENSTRRHRRKVIRDQRFRWPNAEIPYQMTVAFCKGSAHAAANTDRRLPLGMPPPAVKQLR